MRLTVLWILVVLFPNSTGLIVGTLEQRLRKQFGIFASISKPPKMLPPLLNGKEAEEEARARANVNVLFRKQVKCVEVDAYPIPNECIKFLNCTEVGALQETMYCKPGQLFDHLKRYCTYGYEAKCRGVCTQEGEEYPSPFRRKDFLRCQAGIPIRHSCPRGKVFKEYYGKCVDNSSEEDVDSDEDE